MSVCGCSLSVKAASTLSARTLYAKLAFYGAPSTTRSGQRRSGRIVISQATNAREAEASQELATIGVLIPVWQPPPDLPDLVRALLARGFRRIVIVDDGSDREHQPIFDQLEAMPSVEVLRHIRNCGKGRALKTGLSSAQQNLLELTGIVTADADGQHLPEDIQRVGLQLLSRDACVLGSRTFDRKAPFKNRIGNQLTAALFRLVTRCKISDSQTGLRGIPRRLWGDLLAVPGERYEYETAVLVELCRSGRTPVEVPIATVYLNGNRSSHFRPLHDSLQIYRALFRAALRPKAGPCRG